MNWNNFLASSDVKILLYLLEHQEARYSELLRDIGKTRGVVASSLRDLKKKKFIERTIIEQTSPIQTKYNLTEKGAKVANLLNQLYDLV